MVAIFMVKSYINYPGYIIEAQICWNAMQALYAK